MLKHLLRYLLIVFLIIFVFNTENKANNTEKSSTDPSDMPYGHYFTVQEFRNWDIQNDPNAPYNKSTIKLRNRISEFNFLANSNARANEGGVSPLVLFSGGSVPSQASADINRIYAFNYWQYTDIMGYWGGGPGVAGYCVMLPTGSVVDLAHKNGVEIFGNIFFAPTVYGGQIQWVEEFLVKEDGKFPVADKLIEAAEYFGFDGWFINQETQGGNSTLASDMVEFMKYLQANSSLKIYWYDAMTESGSVSWQNELNSKNDRFFQDADTLVSDYMFLNFWWWQSSKLANSKTYAKSLGRDEFKVYAGIDCAIKGYETYVDWDRLFPANEEHNTSVGLYRPDDFLWYQPTTMEERLKREKRFWSGENGDPSNTETSHAWKGFANYIPANSVVDDIPFTTNFSLGLGYDYYINGERLSDSTRSEKGWNNIALQDILPTWRWLVESSGTELDVNFDFTDAYYGGNSIKFSGNLSSDNQVKLYRTQLVVSNDTKMDIAFNLGKTGATNLKVGLAFEDAPSSFQFIDVGDAATDRWNLKTLDLSSFAGKTIAVISLFFEANSNTNYELKLGRLSVYNDQIVSPAPPSNLNVENKVNEQDFVTLRLKWDHSPDKISHYNVYKKNQNGSRTFLGGSINNACFIPWVGQEPNETDINIEIEAVGEDYGVSSPVTSSFNWYSPPGKAANPSPADGAVEIFRNTKLAWTSGSGTETHEIYIGKTTEIQSAGIVSANEFDPGILDPNTTYYWRVDEKNFLYTTEGELWSFTTGAGILDTLNKALDFDGADDYVNCGNDASLQITGKEITLEAWINAEKFKSEVWQGVILAKDQGGAGVDFGYMMRCGKDGRLNFNVGNGQWNELNSPSMSVTLNTWHHVACVMDGTNMIIYVDGIEQAKKALSSTSIKNASNVNLLIGDSPAFSGRVFNGKIDEVRIWNVGRTPEQINKTMNMKLTSEYYSTADSGLAGYWNFDEGEGQTLSDLTFNGNDGTLGSSGGTDTKDPQWTKSSAIVSIDEITDAEIPTEFLLDQNYPNPFNPSTTISFSVSETGSYKLAVYNVLGQTVDKIFDEEISAGKYKVDYNAEHLCSGIYFYRLIGQNVNITKKMILLK